MKTFKAFVKQLFGAKYESAVKSLAVSVILYFALYAAEFRLAVAPFILYMTSSFFSAGIMWQMLNGTRQRDIFQGMFMLPFENRSLVFSYVSALGAHTLITKTLWIWVLFFAAAPWSGLEAAAALFCGLTACFVTAAVYLMFRKRKAVLPILWIACIFAVIFIIRQSAAVLAIALASLAGAAAYLFFADAYAFYNTAPKRKSVSHKGQKGNVFVYLARYLGANKSYCMNTAGLCIAGCFLPTIFRELQGLHILPVGFALLCLNTPVCTLLSGDPDLEQAVRVLPRQAGRFGRRYCLFIFAVNGFVSCFYLCSWQLINGGITAAHIWTAILFALQSAVLSVILEWKSPIRNWKTESDLWHHPRKYLVPLLLMIIAGLVGAWTPILWIWSLVILIECCILFHITGA